MLIRELMTPNPPVLTPHMTLPDALAFLKEKKVHRMAVVNGHGTLVGIIAETDLHNATPSPATLLSYWEIPVLLAKITVEALMVRDVLTVTEDTPVEDAARIMADHNIGCLPVMNGQTLVGMVNQNDLFRVFMELMGARRKGVRIWARTDSSKGTVARISSAIAEASGDIVGLGILEIHDAQGTRGEITLKVQDVPEDRLVDVVKPFVVELLDVRSS
ncbi:MAG: CBS domain-containing protein [Holophaga sp.]|nr:CBS domain-containing protein [Holophaga sp.]